MLIMEIRKLLLIILKSLIEFPVIKGLVWTINSNLLIIRKTLRIFTKITTKTSKISNNRFQKVAILPLRDKKNNKKISMIPKMNFTSIGTSI